MDEPSWPEMVEGGGVMNRQARGMGGVIARVSDGGCSEKNPRNDPSPRFLVLSRPGKKAF